MSFALELDSAVDGTPVGSNNTAIVAISLDSPRHDGPRLSLIVRQPEASLQASGECSVDVDIGPLDFAWLVKYWLTNTDLSLVGEDPRLDLVDFCKRLIVGGGLNPGREILTMPPGCSLNAPPAREDKRERVITLDQLGGNHAFVSPVDVATPSAAVVAAVAVPPPVSPPSVPE